MMSFKKLEGDFEITNAHAQLLIIVMGETEYILFQPRRLQDVHNLPDRLEEHDSALK